MQASFSIEPKGVMSRFLSRSVFALIVGSATAPVLAVPDFTFVEVGNQRGILPYVMANGMGAGIAAADYDGDGDIDVFVPNGLGVPDQLYRNVGNGQFDEIAAGVGLASVERNRAALWFDYDGDSLMDLVVATDNDTAPTSCRLYRQAPDGQFEDVTVAAGLFGAVFIDDGAHIGGLCAGDINNDSYLDLYVCLWGGEAYLFLNNTQGGFDDISVPCGVNGFIEHWQPIMHDFDGDGWLDIFQAVDFSDNLLWLNQRDNTFVDVAVEAGINNSMNDMGVAAGDYDNDGDIDIYITNVFETGEHNVLHRNDSVGTSLAFAEVSQSLAVDNGYCGWGTTFLDADNDGWLDLAATNGWLGLCANDPSRFWLNTGGASPTFVDVSSEVQFDDTEWGSGLIALDYDRDGDLDLLQACNSGPLRLLENQQSGTGADNNTLVVQPRMAGPNSQAIGALVRLTAGQTTQMRLITAGTSFLSQEPAEAFFGIGQATVVDAVTIDWPDGSQTILADVAANQLLTVAHGGFGDLDADGDADDADLAAFIACSTGPGPGPGVVIYAEGCRPSDMDGDGDVDCDDWQVFKGAVLASNNVVPLLGIDDFVAALLGTDPGPVLECIADVNDDGTANGVDIQAYLTAVLSGD